MEQPTPIVVLNNIDLNLLKRQKLSLLRAMEEVGSYTIEQDLQGILNVLDEIHDQLEPLD